MPKRKGATKYAVWSVGCNVCADRQHGIYADKGAAEQKARSIKSGMGPECNSIVRIFEEPEWIDA